MSGMRKAGLRLLQSFDLGWKAEKLSNYIIDSWSEDLRRLGTLLTIKL